MEFIEEIEEIANAKPKEEKLSELDKANKLIQEEKVKRENAFAKDLQLLCEKYKFHIKIGRAHV